MRTLFLISFILFFNFVSKGWATKSEITELVPILLFHGGGGGTPPVFKDMSTASQQLEGLGFPPEHIYQLHYPDSKDIADINQALKPQFETVFNRYPPSTQFDLMGHSLGHVVSLVSVAKLGLLPRIRKLIGLAGVIFGQLGSKPGLCEFEILAPYYCGDIFDLLIGTTQPPFILELLETHENEISQIEKCSLFSPDDGILNPYDSGAFEDGINVSIPRVHHLEFKSSPRVFFEMKKACF
ncbi:MAG: hypothetical protein EB078_00665 [Proteobacteria bacterium]|nr:hypothetical protein [Pseudomonadota bacterium]NDC23978.1 hypothetical protein [Pseudomonadota bacterium]NDD03391.1 hypothetical protein [Pseudomonadota bacterium]NDG25748.1 hypothetical protein [Pseudomonadota bacterium]